MGVKASVTNISKLTQRLSILCFTTKRSLLLSRVKYKQDNLDSMFLMYPKHQAKRKQVNQRN